MRKGVYLLLIELSEEREIEIGSLGKFKFESGFYVYVGSAMNGLDARTERHKGRDKNKHWHIDYFLENTKVISVFKIPTSRNVECDLNRKISNLSSETPVKNFGSSDCDCKAHFHRF